MYNTKAVLKNIIVKLIEYYLRDKIEHMIFFVGAVIYNDNQ